MLKWGYESIYLELSGPRRICFRPKVSADILRCLTQERLASAALMGNELQVGPLNQACMSQTIDLCSTDMWPDMACKADCGWGAPSPVVSDELVRIKLTHESCGLGIWSVKLSQPAGLIDTCKAENSFSKQNLKYLYIRQDITPK